MKVTITTEVSCCRECPHVTNSSREHNDSFTSEPYPTTWYCTCPVGEGRMVIKDSSKIDDNCPLRC